jgi:hypothetical protein
MNFFYTFLHLCKKIIYESGEYVIYKIDSPTKNQIIIDEKIKKYSSPEEIPTFIKKKLLKFPILNPMYYRLKFRKAMLLCLYFENQIFSYGWIQNWKPFRKKFGWLIKNGTMLGPFWTDPQFRGQGYYKRLLLHSVSIADKKKQIIIYTSPNNITSQKGIEKVGFKKIGTYKIALIFRLIVWHSKIVDNLN